MQYLHKPCRVSSTIFCNRKIKLVQKLKKMLKHLTELLHHRSFLDTHLTSASVNLINPKLHLNVVAGFSLHSLIYPKP